MNNIPTHILIRDANEVEEIKDDRIKAMAGIFVTELTVSGEFWILKMDKELENRYQSIKAELETYEEFTLLPPHQLL